MDGAAVRVSIVCFACDFEGDRYLDGVAVNAINPNLTGKLNVMAAKRLAENRGTSFQGANRLGPLDISAELASTMIDAPINVNGLSNGQVIRPSMNGSDITGRPRGVWIIDFAGRSIEEASYFEMPFEYVRRVVKPIRDEHRRPRRKAYWWQHGETVPGIRSAFATLGRFIATPAVAKHRQFVWMPIQVLPDHRLFVFAREDDYFFGVLHSRPHEVWSLAASSRHGVGNDPTYNNTTCFETFPFPLAPGHEPAGDARVDAIAAAARSLVEKRDRWLNPEGAPADKLKKRTLTNLYNQRPVWLAMAHATLDRAVFDAYGWPHDLTNNQILERLLALNLERARRVSAGR